jgi:hypothetical protein
VVAAGSRNVCSLNFGSHVRSSAFKRYLARCLYGGGGLYCDDDDGSVVRMPAGLGRQRDRCGLPRQISGCAGAGFEPELAKYGLVMHWAARPDADNLHCPIDV